MASARPVRSSVRVAGLSKASSGRRPPSLSSSVNDEGEEEPGDSGQRTAAKGEGSFLAQSKAEELDTELAGASIQKILEPADKLLSLLILDEAPEEVYERMNRDARFRNSISYYRRAFGVEWDQLTHEAFINQSVIYELLQTPQFTAIIVKANLAQLADTLFVLRNEQTLIEDREVRLMQISRMFPTQFDCSLEDEVEVAIELLTQIFITCLGDSDMDLDTDGILVNVFASVGEYPRKNDLYTKLCTDRLKQLRRMSDSQVSLEAMYPFSGLLMTMCDFVKRRLGKLSIHLERKGMENESEVSDEPNVQFTDIASDRIVAEVMKRDWKGASVYASPRGVTSKSTIPKSSTLDVRNKDASSKALVQTHGTSRRRKDPSKTFLDKQIGAQRVGDVTNSYLSERSPSLISQEATSIAIYDAEHNAGIYEDEDKDERDEENGNGMEEDERLEIILRKRKMFSDSVQNNKKGAQIRLRNQRARRGPRKQWSLEQEGELIRLIGRYGNHWAGLAADHCTPNQLLGQRGQVELKDKARNLKLGFLRDGRQLPPGFDFVTGQLKE